MEKHKPYGVYERFFKRPLDILCAVLALTVFCWLYALVAILVKVKLGSPVLFRQKRPGKNERIFGSSLEPVGKKLQYSRKNLINL